VVVVGVYQVLALAGLFGCLSFLWNYRVFRCSVSLRVIVVFRDIIYVINILYL
jgi:hypothetical protein